jgi:hypothetical protein
MEGEGGARGRGARARKSLNDVIGRGVVSINVFSLNMLSIGCVLYSPNDVIGREV